MHLEFLVEDSSGARLAAYLLPKLVGEHGRPHTWRIHPYKGLGRLPANLKPRSDAQKRILLDQLPRLLSGYGRASGIDLVVVVIDSDGRDCIKMLTELKGAATKCVPAPEVLFRLAIEEIEAWYLGDKPAILKAYPKARQIPLNDHVQDSTRGTWETLADAVHPGRASALRKAGFPAQGAAKHQWAEKIGPLMNVDTNASPSFCKLRDGLRRALATR